MNYIFFNESYDTLVTYGGFEQISNAANDNFQKLSLTFPAQEAGYLYIYVSNESNLDVNVYFDDLKITHSSNLSIVSADDYYPFGLTFNEYQNQEEQGNFHLYQGKELQEDLGLNTYDFHARMYDPTLGRTFQIDPLSFLYSNVSPYSWVLNNPIRVIDPTGMAVTETDSSTTYTGKDARSYYKLLKKSVDQYNQMDNSSDEEANESEEDPRDAFNNVKAVSDATSVVGFGITSGKTFQKYTGLKVGKFSNFRFKSYSEGFQGNQYVRIIRLKNAVNIGGSIVTAIGLGADAYNLMQTFDTPLQEEAMNQLIKSSIMTGIYIYQPEIGLLITLGDLYINSPQGQSAIQEGRKIRQVKEDGGRRFNLPKGPLFFEPKY